jgi:hypothetical protein
VTEECRLSGRDGEAVGGDQDVYEDGVGDKRRQEDAKSDSGSDDKNQVRIPSWIGAKGVP